MIVSPPTKETLAKWTVDCKSRRLDGDSARGGIPLSANQVGSPAPLVSFFVFFCLSLSFSPFAHINSAVQNYRGTSANGAAKVASENRPAISASYKNIRGTWMPNWRRAFFDEKHEGNYTENRGYRTIYIFLNLCSLN